MKDYYVLLTGGKNNAGDFLIKHRAKLLLNELRPDRELIDFNAWQPFDKKDLDLVNNSKALLLTGGPSLRKKMYPSIYKMVKNLDEIEVPIIFFGVGWKSKSGNWEDTLSYPFTQESDKLLEKIFSHKFPSSVRDYHSMAVLENLGYNNVYMTGCPALYDLDHLNKDIDNLKINNVLFSAGATQTDSKITDKDQKEIILLLNKKFNNQLKVAFHHSIEPSYLKTDNPNLDLYYKNLELVEWLNDKNIPYIDISGTESLLINEYSKADFHVGYRVHAHIFMSSISKPSILLTEDGRGKALKEILPRSIVDGYAGLRSGFVNNIFKKLRIKHERFIKNENLLDVLSKKINWEMNDSLTLKIIRQSIDGHYVRMKKFISELP